MPNDAPSRNKLKTHCFRGHPFDEENTHWYRDRRICRECARTRKPSEKQKEYRRGYWARRLKEDPEAIRVRNARQHRNNARIRAEVLRAYGGDNPHCDCCGESGEPFLVIDHINGGGLAERKRVRSGSGTAFYFWLRRHGWPQNGYRILCHNCNMARGMRGKCPHELKRMETPCPTK